MAYDYRHERPFVFTEEGQIMFLKVRDRAKEIIAKGGVVTSGCLMRGLTGTTWSMLACIDRMVEIGELIEIPNTLSRAGQHRIFTSPNGLP